MIEIVRSAVAEALADGYSGLRAIGEMGWAVAPATKMKSLVDYERGLNEAVFTRGRLTGLCLYDAGLFGATVLREIADSHPRVLGEGGTRSGGWQIT